MSAANPAGHSPNPRESLRSSRGLQAGIMTRLALLCRTAALAAAPARAGETLRAGFGAADVTPEVGGKPVYLAGFGKDRKATRVHDPIMARAVVLEADRVKVALVSVDVVGLF